jgi:uncharacterized membrane protein
VKPLSFRGLALPASILIALAVGHLGVVTAYPYWAMSTAMDRISQDGAAVNQWRHGQRATGASRRIVRPSPDLANSSCVYDLADGPIRVTAAAWDGYMSVSVYSANSDNIFVVNDRAAPGGVDMMIYERGTARPSGADLVVESPSEKGIVLQRRLAPTPERFALAAAARASDVCGTLADRGL